MKWAHRLLGVLLGLLLAGTLVRILPAAFQGGDQWTSFIADVESDRFSVIVTTLMLLIGLVLYALTALNLAPRPRYLAYDTQYGNISISLKALQEFLSHIKDEFPTVLSLDPRVAALNEGLEVVLQVSVRAGTPIPEVSKMLQERARRLIEDRVGIADIRSVEIKVEEIVSELGSDAQEIKSMRPPTGEVP